MDARKDLKAYRNNGEKAQEIYDKFILPYRTQNIRLKNQWPTDTDDNTNEWTILCNCKCMGRPMHSPDIDLGTNRDMIPTTLNVSWKLITTQAEISGVVRFLGNPYNSRLRDKRPDHNAARKWKERKEEKISAGGPSFTISGTVVGSVGREEADSHISARDRSPPFPFKVQQISVWELLRDKHLVSSSKNETRDHNQNPYDQHFTWNSNGSLSKLPEISNQLLDLLRHGIHKITSEISLKYNEMEKDMQYLGPDLITGIENFLFYPDNILYDYTISDEPEFEDEEE
ncbi:hypothetical protein RhiirA1_448723 [Rhizophagus irregularis]|uniref:Uncharacterized protein n=1 Tax=Rhizophagus irregularis TaxID=588596 RepID=A0A2N0SJ02_9GLOM|nr:hypothetical protein RhiirA1_448723 [Rhizophagus irregularis]